MCSNRAATQANILKYQENRCVENISISLIRKRSLVRVQAGPPEKSFDLQRLSLMLPEILSEAHVEGGSYHGSSDIDLYLARNTCWPRDRSARR